ncbi:uncharacterized protein LOC144908999 [Branchiostoma floridae x Branchiostoma belcheri]
MAVSRNVVFGAAFAVCCLLATLTIMASYTYVSKEKEPGPRYNKHTRHLLQNQLIAQPLETEVADSRCNCSRRRALIFANGIPKGEQEEVLQRKKQELLKYRKRWDFTTTL